MPKSKILLQISGDVPTEKTYFTTAGAKKNLKAHFKVCLGNFKVVTLVFSSVSLGLLRHDMSMKHTIYGHTHIVFFHPRLLNWVGVVETLPTVIK